MRLLTILLFIYFGFAGATSAQKPTSKEVRIGVIIPLSGDMAVHGQEIRRAMELALEQARKDPMSYEYRLLFEDNQLDGAKSVTAARRLIDLEKVDVIITL